MRANIPGVGANDVEQGFLRGSTDTGKLGSVRIDVVIRDSSGTVIVLLDIKTGLRGMSGPRLEQLRRHTLLPPDAPIIEMALNSTRMR